MSKKERDSITSNLHNRLAQARSHRALLIEKLRIQKKGLKIASAAVKQALKDGNAAVTRIPECPDRHEVEQTLLDLKRAREKVREWKSRVGKCDGV